MSSEPNKIIYSMIRVSKFFDKKPVLKDISLSYFYGAKIGVLGLNGAGKSSLLRILAGVDTEFNGETVLSPGHTIGYLEQEPLVNVDKTVREVVEEGVGEAVDLIKEFEEIKYPAGRTDEVQMSLAAKVLYRVRGFLADCEGEIVGACPRRRNHVDAAVVATER